MPIEFRHSQSKTGWRITSPQLPGWACSAPTKDAAFGQCAGSLRSYLRDHSRIPIDLRREIKAMISASEG